MPIPVVEITVDDPTQPWRDQLDAAFVRKSISASEMQTLHQWLYSAEHAGTLPASPSDMVRMPLADNRVAFVTSHGAVTKTVPGTAIREQHYGSARQEIDARCKALMQTGLTLDAAQQKVANQDHTLWARYRHETAFPGHPGGPQPDRQDRPTVAGVLKMADDMVAKASGVSKRQILEALVEEHRGEDVYLNAYRAYHNGEGFHAHQAGTGVETRMPADPHSYMRLRR
jgi:hypothetical protein